MKKKSFLILLTLIIVKSSFAQLKSPNASPRSNISQIIGLVSVNLDYSRPSKKSREIFGGLVPYNKIWRTGANNPTTISFSDYVKINNQLISGTTQQGQNSLLEAAGQVDILVTNAGGPPPGLWSDWDRDDFIRALDANMLTPIALMKALLPEMSARGWGRVVNITSQSVKAPIGVLGLSNAARTGLTGYVAGTARQVAGTGVTINNLLPGIHATDRAASLDAGVCKAQGISLEEAQAQRCATIPAGRYGTAAEFGAACAFLCSQYAGFIVGQNILLDGGAVNATL